ncbi:hypothetical protein CC78DRAFT_174203 [Lojkania enalia]|uniref:Uncharacterized protein n=1 Tax=Lojkania enalia TaxID=147567 RepID=A0A9P4N8N9_9PLEO|nr:hypothetical protein CC78DRAFT_174203 [Didymosphaeria enalia]
MSDTDKAFAFLSDNIPSWLKQLAHVEEKIAQMRSEIAKVPVNRYPPLKRKTGSVESIRDLDAIMEVRGTSTPAQQSPVITRKRKTPSVLSGQTSGPIKYRSRTMIIVQYDGEIQKAFETLVRNIGTARNMLRKGKMAAKLEAMVDLVGSDDDSEGDDDDVMAKIGYRRRVGISSMRMRGAMRNGGTLSNVTTSPTELFDTTDKSLELAQVLCEKAAHQSLRDGECKAQLDTVGKHFEETLETASKEVAKRVARREREAAKEESNINLSPSTTVEANPTVAIIRPTVSAALTTAKAVDIEIDDNSEEEDFVMPPIRLTSRA